MPQLALLIAVLAVSTSAPLVRAAIGVFNKHGSVPSVSVRIAGSAPYYVFTDLGLPLIQRCDFW